MSSASEALTDPEQYVRELLPRLRGLEVTYFPVRHHSPACARHVDRWIRKHRPASVIIEGPESFNAFVESLADPRCQLPVALYTDFVDMQQRLAPQEGKGSEQSSTREQARFAAYYPLCDYSPELIALRTGLEAGAQVRFADLEFAEKLLHSHGASVERRSAASQTVRVDSLADDPHLAYSEYTTELAHRLGCRDFNELWDHLFEAGPAEESTADFIDRLATFCAMSRLVSSPRQLQNDGTLAREDCMAAAIRIELEKNRKAKRRGPVLVVTGGFHTVALPALVDRDSPRPALPLFRSGETGTWLIPYSFDRLDALSGYGSGMPSPAFYDRLWQADVASGNSTGPHRFQAICDLVLDVGRLARERRLPSNITTPDAIAAVQMIEQLAQLRGHATPQREDVLDGLRGCLVKGAMEPDGQLLMAVVEQLLAGDRVGQVPPGTNVPPIVDDFRQLAHRFKLPTESIQIRELQFDLYRKPQSREVSRLLHQLNSLSVPFAQFIAGPDFQRGIELERMQETWQVRWTPGTEAGLIEAAVYGSSIREAAGNRMREQVLSLTKQPGEHGTAQAVSLLMASCCMGLHQLSGELLSATRQIVAIDSQLPSLSHGLTQLVLLHESREPLEATKLAELPDLIETCYQRACQLTREAGHCPESAIDDWLAALGPLRELLSIPLADASDQRNGDESPVVALDPVLWHQALRYVIRRPLDQTHSVIAGAAAGILYSEGQLSSLELIQYVRGFLAGTQGAHADPSGVLRGLLSMSRDIAWNVPEILSSLDELFTSWDEETFLQALPDLRLAFADLTPQETHRVAERVVTLHAGADADSLTHITVAEEDLQYGLALSRRVRELLQRDGLAD